MKLAGELVSPEVRVLDGPKIKKLPLGVPLIKQVTDLVLFGSGSGTEDFSYTSF